MIDCLICLLSGFVIGINVAPWIYKRDAKPDNVPRPSRFDCPDCGQGVTVDQDGCCADCGASAAVFVDGCMVQDFDGNRAEPEKPESP